MNLTVIFLNLAEKFHANEYCFILLVVNEKLIFKKEN